MSLINTLIAELKAAVAQDRGAKAEAMQHGLDATQPLSLVRLGELCALGDRMNETAKIRRLAQMRLHGELAREPH